MSPVIKKKERKIAPGMDQQKEMQYSWITELYIQKIRRHTVQRHSQNAVPSKQQCIVCSNHLFHFALPKNLRCFCDRFTIHISDGKELRLNLKTIRTRQPNWSNPNWEYKYTYRTHSAVFSAAEYNFQSTQLGFPY